MYYHEFKTHYCCSRDAFYWILDQIKDHPTFNNEQERKQAEVEHQLMLLLHFLGEESVINRSQRTKYCFFEDCRNRCVEAIRSLQDKYIAWPDEAERKQISHRILKKYQIPNTVGVIYGTLLVVSRWD